MGTSRNIRFTDKAQLLIEKYRQQYGCSFNQAVNDLIKKAGSEARQGKQRNQTMQEQVESIFQWVKVQEGKEGKNHG